jgi:thioredoxin-dependent peroxiredoxin
MLIGRTKNRITALSAVCAVLLGLGAAVAQAAEILPGAMAPGFKLQDQTGTWHQLADFRGKWVVLYFYPKDATPGCTTEACEFRDNIFAFNKIGATILGISVDDVNSHKSFAKDNNLPFTLLADSNKQTAKDYGVLKRLLGVMEVAKRETFLIDPQGRIVKRYSDVNPNGHSRAVLADLTALQKK